MKEGGKGREGKGEGFPTVGEEDLGMVLSGRMFSKEDKPYLEATGRTIGTSECYRKRIGIVGE